MHSLGKTVNELHAMLKLHEQTLTLPKNNAPALHAIRAGKVQKGKKHKKPQPQMAARGQNQGNRKYKHAYAPNPKIPPPPKREDPAKDSIYHEYGKAGHWKRNCPQYLAELLKKKKNIASRGGGSGIFTIELNTFLNRSWIYDTGCGTHICNTTHGLRESRKLKPRALSLYIGNGQCEAVEAIAVFYLCLPSGLEIVLNNLLSQGGGIFEIDLSNSYANESSIYTVSNKRAKLDLDSTLLWHCRLGHISKKRIEKLQHDGLLNSTDLRAFEKCVPCMSGKMTRKPYTHQVERAKDLLGLIHTDVCGLFKIMSRQGANYFVTFTDDFSRYGYVYLLKHKHKVFETFKVFQKEVENQLGLWDYHTIVPPPYISTTHVCRREETESLLDIRAIRILIAITAYYDYKIWQIDVKNVFLNGYLNEEVYMDQPEGFVNPKYTKNGVFFFMEVLLTRRVPSKAIFSCTYLQVEEEYNCAFDVLRKPYGLGIHSGLGVPLKIVTRRIDTSLRVPPSRRHILSTPPHRSYLEIPLPVTSKVRKSLTTDDILS
ncbi:retrotransposon protein, putative, ty1-copia subclass [Tanacetum coccineum]